MGYRRCTLSLPPALPPSLSLSHTHTLAYTPEEQNSREEHSLQGEEALLKGQIISRGPKLILLKGTRDRLGGWGPCNPGRPVLRATDRMASSRKSRRPVSPKCHTVATSSHSSWTLVQCNMKRPISIGPRWKLLPPPPPLCLLQGAKPSVLALNSLPFFFF